MATVDPSVEYPFRKVTLADPDVAIPGSPYFGHGATTTLADVGWQHDEIARLLADGATIIDDWWVDQCAAGCGRVFRVNADDVGTVICRDCGIADMEAKHGADW